MTKKVSKATMDPSGCESANDKDNKNYGGSRINTINNKEERDWETNKSAGIDTNSSNTDLTDGPLRRPKEKIFPPGFFKQRHCVKERGRERRIEIKVVVEDMRFFFYLMLLLILFVGYVLTKVFTPSYIRCKNYSKILTDVFGSLSICVYFDFPPATYVLPTLYTFQVILAYLYCFASIFRAWIAKEEKKISGLSFKVYCAAFIYAVTSASFFSTIFAVKPNLKHPKSIVVHTIPFTAVTIALCVVQVAVTWFGNKVAWVELKHPKWLRITSWLCLICMIVSTIGKVISHINALSEPGECHAKNWKDIVCGETEIKTYVCGKGWFANVHEQSYISINKVNEISWNVFAVLFPLLQSGYFWFQRFRTHAIIVSVGDNKQA